MCFNFGKTIIYFIDDNTIYSWNINESRKWKHEILKKEALNFFYAFSKNFKIKNNGKDLKFKKL